ncbi:leucine--tRNA ligase [Candidatus Gottesmanbacteria bacterium]|nr:leucine--tRNA ligase [Candidatus Gottesmanbacteria bacterium]
MKTASQSFDHKSAEAKWEEVWQRAGLDLTDIRRAKQPFYNLMMFPYPSAEGLHVGNMYAFTGSDIYGRFKRMEGYDVFEPIGLDGFGIHSENYAFKIGKHPMDQAKISERRFYNQLHSIGAMYDWSRTVETYNLDYYRWTQWLFVQMFKHGLAYRAKANVNWCPSCKTVLADEQVIEERCERCGNIVSNRLLEQWFFRITAYAGKLLDNLPTLDWAKKVKIAQEKWIGKKEGINIDYPVKGTNEVITCFTTAPVNFGMTFIVLSPQYLLVQKILSGEVVVAEKNKKEIQKYIEESAKKKGNKKEKTGVFTGLFARNRVAGWDVPIWIADFVMAEVGTGAVQGCPGHDYRDFEFAKKYDLSIIRVVVGPDGDASPIDTVEKVIVSGMPGTMINSKFLDGLDFASGLQKTMDYIEEKGWGKRVASYHLRDWLISRQRYWGPPIPMIFCKSCAKEGKSWFTTEEGAGSLSHFEMSAEGASRSEDRTARKMGQATKAPIWAVGWYAVSENDLPVLLPRIEDYKPGDDGVAPLAKHKEFYQTTCPGCGGKAVRETDVSDTFLDSSWYFLRYPSVNNVIPAKEPGSQKELLPWDPTITKRWLPVHMYTGGAEHSVLHLLYSRFVTMALKDMGHINFEEPFTRFYAHGLVIKDGAKMSKSKGNVVNPDEYIEKYGADALRLYLMFTGPFDAGGDFRDSAMEGMSRWVGRIWRMALPVIDSQSKASSATVQKALQKLIKKVSEDTEHRRYNTAIAAMMEFTNLACRQAGLVADEGGALGRDDLKIFIKLLAPYAPYLAEELWQRTNAKFLPRRQAGKMQNAKLEKKDSIHFQPWPTFDAGAIKDESVAIIVQVNGKHRDTIKLSAVSCQLSAEVEDAARTSEKVKKHLANQIVKNVIFVPGRLINFVLG